MITRLLCWLFGHHTHWPEFSEGRPEYLTTCEFCEARLRWNDARDKWERAK